MSGSSKGRITGNRSSHRQQRPIAPACLQSAAALDDVGRNYDGDALVGEYVGGTLVRRYAHGAGVDELLVWWEGAALTDRRFLHADHQGSIIGASDASGFLLGAPYPYGPYGEPASWAGPRFRYTGQAALPEAQLYHYKARVYDPALGRFLQTDPVGYEDDLNLYAYMRNDPLNLQDPEGRFQRGTVSVQVEQEVVTFNDPNPAHGSGVGVFANLHDGVITFGTFTTSKEAAGSDAGGSLALGVTGGGVDDFAGLSESIEVDFSVDGVAATGELGRTFSGELVLGVELGPGIPGISGGETTTTIGDTIVVDVPQAVEQTTERVNEGAARAGRAIQSAPERVRRGAPGYRPTDRRRER